MQESTGPGAVVTLAAAPISVFVLLEVSILLLLILTCQVFVLLGVGFAVLALALFLLGCCVLAIGHLRARFVFFVKLCNLFWFPRWQVDMGTWLDWVSCFKKLFLEWGIRSFFSSGRSLQKAFALPFKAAVQLRTEKGHQIPKKHLQFVANLHFDRETQLGWWMKYWPTPLNSDLSLMPKKERNCSIVI